MYPKRFYRTHIVIFNTDKLGGWNILENIQRESVGSDLGLQKNLYWMRSVRANMSAPWMDMAHRFLPTMSQLRGSWKRSSPEKHQYHVEFSQHKKNNHFFIWFFLFLLLPSREKRKKLKALLYSLCVIRASSQLLSTSSGCDLVAKLSKQKGITQCVFLLATAKYIFVKSSCRAGNCQLFEVLFRRIHGKNQFQVPLGLQKKGREKWKRKNCHLRPIRKQLISCTFHVQVSFG